MIFKKFWKWVICGFCLILLVSGTGIAYAKGIISPAVLANLWRSPEITNLTSLGQSSTAQVSVDGKKVSLKLRLSPKDKVVMDQFAGNLGAGNAWLSGVTLTLDEGSTAMLANYLPLQTKLQISPNKIIFGKPDQYSSPEASESAIQQVVVNNLSDGGKLIEISDPDQALAAAVSSGQVQLSDNLVNKGLWQLLAKVAKIKIEVHGQKLSGEIDLR